MQWVFLRVHTAFHVLEASFFLRVNTNGQALSYLCNKNMHMGVHISIFGLFKGKP